MATPSWTVYRGKEYVASCKHPGDAWLLCGDDASATVRWGHTLTVWAEATDNLPYMTASQAEAVMRQRVADKWHETNKKLGVAT